MMRNLSGYILAMLALMAAGGCAAERDLGDYMAAAERDARQLKQDFVEYVVDEPMTERPTDFDPYLLDSIHNPSMMDSEAKPSVTGLDRQWSPIAVTAPRGYVAHWPTYLSNEQPELQPVLTRRGDIAEIADLVTTPDSFDLDGRKFGQLATESAMFALEAALLPWRMYQTPPWTTVYSPEYR